MNNLIYSTNKIQTKVLDPIYHTNRRTEFQIEPNAVIMGNMRLVDVGFIASQNGSVSNKLGVLGMLVKNIYLMDGGTVVDQMQDLPQFLQFKNQNTPNDKNISVNSKLNGSGNGFYQESGARNNTVSIVNHKGTGRYTNDINTTFKGWIGLNKILSFLDRATYISTTIFERLRLVIEYRNDLHTDVDTILRPALVYDMLIDEKQASQIENALKKQAIVFRPIERDSVVLPAGVVDTKQQKNYNLKAFNGKTLNKVLIYKEPVNNKYNSVTNVGEKVNFVVNGKQILPYDGIDAPNKNYNI
jgi:hypothetical protein